MKKKIKTGGLTSLSSLLVIDVPRSRTKQGKTHTAKVLTKGATALPSVPGIVDPMLLTGKYTRAQVMDEVRRLRPDFKDPSAAVSNGLIRLRKGNQAGGLVEVQRERKAKAPRAARTRTAGNPDNRLPLADKLAKLDAWAACTTSEVEAGFKRLAAYRAKTAAEPKHRQVWA